MLKRLKLHFKNENRTAPEEPSVDEPVIRDLLDCDPLSDFENPSDSASTPILQDLLSQCAGLSIVQQRALTAVVKEIKGTNSLVENKTYEISERFQSLATKSNQQAEQIQEIISLSEQIEIDGDHLSLTDIPEIMEGALQDVISTILFMSKRGIELVYSLDEVVQEISASRRTVEGIEAINKQTHMLALNAKIEAASAGDNGNGFSVIADEVRTLSNKIDELSSEITKQMTRTFDGVISGHDKLKELSSLDMSEHLLAKEKLERIMSAMIRQSGSLSNALSKSGEVSAQVSKDVAAVVVDMQFQDRAKQQLENVIGTLNVLSGSFESFQKDVAEIDDISVEECDVTSILENVISQHTLGDVRKRFIQNALLIVSDEDDAKPEEEEENDNTIELF